MRIMYLLFSFSVGGTERLVADICNQMVLNKQDVYLYIVNDLVSHELLGTLSKDVYVRLQNRKAGGTDKVATLREINKYIGENKIEVVHCNSFNAPELLLLTRICHPRVRIVQTIHGMGQYRDISPLRRKLRNALCDAFIGISNSVLEDMLQSGCSRQKSVMIYNAIRTDRYEVSAYKNFCKDDICIGCIARFMPSVKGQDILVDAVSMLGETYPNVTCIFAGGVADVEREAYDRMLADIERKGLSDHIRFVGLVSDVPKLLKDMDICVVPSRSEGFGLSLIEAMSMGIPCIVSDTGGLKEIVEREQLGTLFQAGNPKSLANQLAVVIANYDTERAKAWESRHRIQETYGIGNMCNQLMDVYRPSKKIDKDR